MKKWLILLTSVLLTLTPALAFGCQQKAAPIPIEIPAKPASLLCSDAEYYGLYAVFKKWGFNFSDLYERFASEGSHSNWTSFWIGSTSNEVQRVYFDRVEDKWKPRVIITITPIPTHTRDELNPVLYPLPLIFGTILGTLLFFIVFGFTRVLYWRERRRRIGFQKGEELIVYLNSIGVHASLAERGLPEAKICANRYPTGRCESLIQIEGRYIEYIGIVSELLTHWWRPRFNFCYLISLPAESVYMLCMTDPSMPSGQSFEEIDSTARWIKSLGSKQYTKAVPSAQYMWKFKRIKYAGLFSNELQALQSRVIWTIEQHGILGLATLVFILFLVGLLVMGLTGVISIQTVAHILDAIGDFFDRMDPYIQYLAWLGLLPVAFFVGAFLYLIIRYGIIDTIIGKLRKK